MELEDELQRRCVEGRLSATIIHAGDYFGGGTGSWLDLVIAKSLRDGKLIYPGPTDMLHAWPTSRPGADIRRGSGTPDVRAAVSSAFILRPHPDRRRTAAGSSGGGVAGLRPAKDGSTERAIACRLAACRTDAA